MAQSGTATTLTAFELAALGHRGNLADGHAYQGLEEMFSANALDVGQIWAACERTKVPDLEARFRDAFTQLAQCHRSSSLADALVCPTASNSIDVVAALVSSLRLRTILVEPTFDNLALIMRRRNVTLESVSEGALTEAINRDGAEGLLNSRHAGALFIVQPNNPTGSTLSSQQFTALAQTCFKFGTLLLIDNSFRFHRRSTIDDLSILEESGVSFIAFEDTGKVWPTNDLKVSLLYSSSNLKQELSEIHSELYLCHSRFALALLERCLIETCRLGLPATIWSHVDRRRALLREAIVDTGLVVDHVAASSTLPVDWLWCGSSGMTDMEVHSRLEARGVMVLPGRHFFWNSPQSPSSHNHVRVAMMKPYDAYAESLTTLRQVMLDEIGATCRS